MKKRIVAFLLAMAMVTTMPTALAINVKAETTDTKSEKTTYGSTTDPGGASSIKEWKNEWIKNDIWAGWYHFKAEDTNWHSLELVPEREGAMEDYGWDETLMTLELWKKTGNSYEKINTMDLTKEDNQFNFHMEKDADYYIYLGGVDDCCGNMEISMPGSIYGWGGTKIPESAQQLKDSEHKKVNVTSSDDIQWFKFTVPEEGRYKITYKDTKNTARIDVLNVSDDCLRYNFERKVIRDGVSYYDLNKGAECYIACTSFKGATSYDVSIKKITQTLTYLNKEHAFEIRKKTKASTIATAQAKASVEYLNKIYTPNKSFSTRIDHAEQDDVEAFKKMAGIITKGCKTDKQKVDAIAKWAKNNIAYDTNTSSYSTTVFKKRRGDCQGISMLIADFCRSLGIPAAYASGWLADLSKWTIDDLYNSHDRYHFSGHGWDMVYFDGKWHMYDVLSQDYDVTDPSKMASSGHYFAWVEGISMVGNGVDPALIGMDDFAGNTIASAYYKGNFVRLVGGLIGNQGNYYEIDQDGEICSSLEEESEGTNAILQFEDLYFPTHASFKNYYPYNGRLDMYSGYAYDDGRENPESGYNFVNGWFSYGYTKYLADLDGVLRNMDIVTIGGKTYYFDENGKAQILNMKKDQYYLSNGELYIKTGVSGRLVNTTLTAAYLDNKDYEFDYSFMEARDEKGNDVDGSTLLEINSDTHTVKTKKPGYVWYTVGIREKGEEGWVTTGASIMFHITNKAKPTYSYKDSKVKSDEQFKPYVKPSVKRVSLSTASYVYDGKVKNPSIKAYDSDGNLISSQYYTISKSSGRKNVGKYKYTIKFKNGYTGEKTLYFTINPKPTKLTSLKKASKKIILKWNKVSSQASGYQIRYGTKSSMSGAKVATVKNYKTISKTISGLKKKKKYYVQIRTYKTVGKGNYYSSWSAKKSIVTK